MAWVSLVVAGMFEIVGVFGMNRIKRNNDSIGYLIFCIGLIMSFLCLSFAMGSIPMGAAYAIWTGIGSAGGALVGMIFFRESRDRRRLFFIGLVLIAAVGLKLIA